MKLITYLLIGLLVAPVVYGDDCEHQLFRYLATVQELNGHAPSKAERFQALQFHLNKFADSSQAIADSPRKIRQEMKQFESHLPTDFEKDSERNYFEEARKGFQETAERFRKLANNPQALRNRIKELGFDPYY